MPDRRDQSRIRHEMTELVMARAAAITSGYKDGNDFDRLRHDPLMKAAVGRCPESGEPLASQSTISRLENAPRKTEAARLTGALVDQFCCSVEPGKEEILESTTHSARRMVVNSLRSGMHTRTSAAFPLCISIM